jgi:hypothetical protein
VEVYLHAAVSVFYIRVVSRETFRACALYVRNLSASCALFSVAESSHDVAGMVREWGRKELFHSYRKSTSNSERVFFGLDDGIWDGCSGLFT